MTLETELRTNKSPFEAAESLAVGAAAETLASAGATIPGSVAGIWFYVPSGGPIRWLESGPPTATWPPPLDGIAGNDLGFVDDGNDRRRVLDELQASATQPQIMVIVTSLTTTPDRCISSFGKPVPTPPACPLGLFLPGGQAPPGADA